MSPLLAILCLVVFIAAAILFTVLDNRSNLKGKQEDEDDAEA